jgi:hypothetical protein
MNVSSTWWIVVIGLGAVLVAVGNIGYSLSSSRERQEAASAKALSMLTIESENNLKHVGAIRINLSEGQLSSETFETTAWSIVSTGGLLVQVDEATLGRIAEVYYLIGLAEKYHSQVLDLATGVSSALQGSGQLRQQYLGFFTRTLDRLEPKLREMLSRHLSAG